MLAFAVPDGRLKSCDVCYLEGVGKEGQDLTNTGRAYSYAGLLCCVTPQITCFLILGERARGVGCTQLIAGTNLGRVSYNTGRQGCPQCMVKKQKRADMLW